MDGLRSILRAAAIAAFSVGLLLVLLNPPSLSGAGGLLTIIAAAVAFVLVVGWATVAMMGSDGPSEEEFERLIRRSEELAASPQLAAEAGEFDLLVADAIDRLPDEFQEMLMTTPVVVSQRGREFGAYGHYYGGQLTPGGHQDPVLPFQGPP